MNAHTGQYHLLRMVIRYSETGGSSLGCRYYFKYLLQKWKERNPQTEVVTQHSQFEHPQMQCYFRSGEVCNISLRKLYAPQIEELMNLYRNSESPNLHLKHGGPRIWTERRSIQGMWQPSFEGMTNALRFATQKEKRFERRQRLKYSNHTIEMNRQALSGVGRWGDEGVQRRGFDMDVLSERVNAETAADGVSPFNTNEAQVVINRLAEEHLGGRGERIELRKRAMMSGRTLKEQETYEKVKGEAVGEAEMAKEVKEMNRAWKEREKERRAARIGHIQKKAGGSGGKTSKRKKEKVTSVPSAESGGGGASATA